MFAWTSNSCCGNAGKGRSPGCYLCQMLKIRLRRPGQQFELGALQGCTSPTRTRFCERSSTCRICELRQRCKLLRAIPGWSVADMWNLGGIHRHRSVYCNRHRRRTCHRWSRWNGQTLHHLHCNLVCHTDSGPRRHDHPQGHAMQER